MTKPVLKLLVPGRAYFRLGLDVCVTAALQVREAQFFSSKGGIAQPPHEGRGKQDTSSKSLVRRVVGKGVDRGRVLWDWKQAPGLQED